MVDSTPADRERLKEAIKEALSEALVERRDLVRDILTEALEDIGLAAAIEEGRATPTVPRDEVRQALEAES